MLTYRARIMKEQNDLRELKDPNMIIFINESDILIWYAYLFGPEGTPYSNGVFKIKIAIPANYPLHPPMLYFQTRIFHPNIHFDTGEVCLDVIKQDWTPQWTIENLIRAIGVMLLANPNADSPLNCDAGNLLRAKDFEGFKSLASYYTERYAIDKNRYLSMLNKDEKKQQ